MQYQYHRQQSYESYLRSDTTSLTLIYPHAHRKRLTAHECLMHAWLRGDYSPRLEPIDMMRYIPIRDKIRAKYKEWEKFLLPIGRLAEYSSLRKLQLEKYRIHDTHFGKFRLSTGTDIFVTFCSSLGNFHSAYTSRKPVSHKAGHFSTPRRFLPQTADSVLLASLSDHRTPSLTRDRASSSLAAS